MQKTVQVNLHDYIAINKHWQQLWANDEVAYWFESLTDEQTPGYAKGYKYLVHETTPCRDIITDNRSFYCRNLSQAFDQWNKLVNTYLGN